MSTSPVGSTLFDGIQFGDPNEIEAVLLNYGAVRSGVLEEAVRIDNADQSARNQRINELNSINALLQRVRPNFDVLSVIISFTPDEVNQSRSTLLQILMQTSVSLQLLQIRSMCN